MAHNLPLPPRAHPHQAAVLRFAPSPTGLLHRGHALSALINWRLAERLGGTALLRIEDIDAGRCRPAYADALCADLQWLGLDWPRPVLRQSTRMNSYADALNRLRAAGLLYPCFCSRADIAAAWAGHSDPVRRGPDGVLYPGTCRSLDPEVAARRLGNKAQAAWRLDMVRATALAGALSWQDLAAGPQVARPDLFGDVVLARRDTPTSYHLAVTIDDAAQQVSHVVRGADLFAATHVHRLLQALLDLPAPLYAHHALLQDEMGRKLAKRRNSQSLQADRAAGLTADQLRDALEPQVSSALESFSQNLL